MPRRKANKNLGLCDLVSAPHGLEPAAKSKSIALINFFESDLISLISCTQSLMSAVEILEIPKQMHFAEPASSGSVPPPLKAAKILVEDQAFDVEDCPVTSSLLRKLRSAEGGLYRFPNEWNVRATQVSALLDHLQSAK